MRRKLADAAPPPEAPLVLIGREGRRRVVLAADAAAQRAGLRVGMPATKAQALVLGLIVMDAEPAVPTPRRSTASRCGRCSAMRRSSPPIRRTDS